MPRPVREFRTASKENYEKFLKLHPKIKLTFKDYKKILYTLNSMLYMHCLETGDRVKVPYGMGDLGISKYKRKKFKTIDGIEYVNLPVDWQESKKQGKKIYLLNHHTDGYSYYWRWNPRTFEYSRVSKIKDFFIWTLEMARVPSRLVNTYIRKPNSKYKDIYKIYEAKNKRV